MVYRAAQMWQSFLPQTNFSNLFKETIVESVASNIQGECMTIETKHYTNNPIVEAFCMVRFSNDDHWEPTLPGEMKLSLQPAYDGKSVSRLDLGKLRPENFDLESVSLPTLYFLKSEDECDLLSLGEENLGVHRIEPYNSWAKDLRPRTEQALKSFFSIIKKDSLQINNINLRYKNTVNIPVELIGAKEFIVISPPLTSGLPNILDNFNTTTIYRSNEFTTLTLFHSMTASATKEGMVELRLDFDVVFDAQDKNMSADQIMDILQDLRLKQYKAFESLITDHLREEMS